MQLATIWLHKHLTYLKSITYKNKLVALGVALVALGCIKKPPK